MFKPPSETPKNVQENSCSKNHKIALASADIKARKASFRQFQAAKVWLEENFPKSFNFKKPKPLKLGIQHDLLSIPSPYSKKLLRKCLGAYVNTKAYLEATLQDSWRYDLNGKKIEEVTQEQKDYALKQLEYKTILWKKNQKTQGVPNHRK
jgi:sRNA-binding protein